MADTNEKELTEGEILGCEIQKGLSKYFQKDDYPDENERKAVWAVWNPVGIVLGENSSDTKSDTKKEKSHE